MATQRSQQWNSSTVVLARWNSGLMTPLVRAAISQAQPEWNTENGLRRLVCKSWSQLAHNLPRKSWNLPKTRRRRSSSISLGMPCKLSDITLSFSCRCTISMFVSCYVAAIFTFLILSTRCANTVSCMCVHIYASSDIGLQRLLFSQSQVNRSDLFKLNTRSLTRCLFYSWSKV